MPILISVLKYLRSGGDGLKCPNCEADNSDSFVYCWRCGAIVMSSDKIDRQKVEQIKGNIRKIAGMSKSTDQFIPPWWLAVYIVGWIVAITIYFISIASAIRYPYEMPAPEDIIGGTIVLLIFVVVLSLFLAMIMYHLVKRQNEHYRREWDLRANILNLFKALAGSPDREHLIYREIAPMLAAHQKAETIRDPRFWAAILALPPILLAIIVTLSIAISNSVYQLPSIIYIGVLIMLLIIVAVGCIILGLYSFYFLGKTLYEHDQRWASFSYGTRRTLVQFGIPLDWAYTPQTIPEREFALYLLLVIIPFFALYWLFTLIIDPNSHFKAHADFEKWLVDALDKLRF